MIKFPSSFFWGAATSSYQVEGANVHSDWWEWERRVGFKVPCGNACRHYDLYKEDFDLAKQLGHNAHRLSIEWSRIEPEEGRFLPKELEHYRDVIIALRERGIEPIITLHHFTNSLWFAKLGGWYNKNSYKYFLRYVKKVTEFLCENARFWVTINEPMVYAYHAYILGAWPPQEKSFLRASRVVDNLAFSHIKAYRLINDVYKERKLSRPSIGIAKNMQAFEPCKDTLKNRVAVHLRDRLFNFSFIDKLIKHQALDFIGMNYYTRSLVEVKKWHFRNLFLDVCEENHSQLKKNSLGWDIYPQGLYSLLLALKKYNLPIFILENGICTQDDTLRWDFICQHLKSLHLAIKEGVNVLGYIYWSLIDNFEWAQGFSPRFGLIEVDYNTYNRKIRESARKFARVCKTGALDM